MRALICRRWGAVDEPTVGEAPIPETAPGEVLIRVKATAANYADSIMVAGRYQTKPPLPFSPGLETAGIVAACGREVSSFKSGDRVMAILAYGGFAEFAVAPAEETYVIPDGMSLVEAGAFPIAYISSHVAIRWQGRWRQAKLCSSSVQPVVWASPRSRLVSPWARVSLRPPAHRRSSPSPSSMARVRPSTTRRISLPIESWH